MMWIKGESTCISKNSGIIHLLGLILVSIGRIVGDICNRGDVCDFSNQHKQA